jgi:hypothetical protein
MVVSPTELRKNNILSVPITYNNNQTWLSIMKPTTRQIEKSTWDQKINLPFALA